MSDIKRVYPPDRCAKCGERDSFSKPSLCRGLKGERLEFQCVRCGYRLSLPTAEQVARNAAREALARTMSDAPAFLCEVCHDQPWWRITRRGDAATSWACPTDLSSVCLGMQRLGERTELVVTETEPYVNARYQLRAAVEAADLYIHGATGDRPANYQAWIIQRRALASTSEDERVQATFKIARDGHVAAEQALSASEDTP